MMRTFSALAVLILAAAVGRADEKTVVIRWHGQSFFDVLSSSGTRIALDPHLLEEYPRVVLSADAILMSHHHVDHAKPEAIQNYRRAKQIHAIKQTAGRAQEWSLI